MESIRDSIIHGLRSQGWSRIEAENEADHRIELMRQKAKVAKETALRTRHTSTDRG